MAEVGRPRKQLTTLVSGLARGALNLLLPISCAVCRTEGRFLCAGCELKLPRLERPYCIWCSDRGREPLCDWCAAAPPTVDGIRAPYVFEGAVRDLVHDLKYRNLRASAPELAGLMADCLRRNDLSSDVLAPVPLHRGAERLRGYNQSLLLCRELAKLADIPMRAGLLRRKRDTPPQVSMGSHDERRRNMVGAFECDADVRGLAVLVIDDVVTTGSTMSACADALKASGAASVWGLALARQTGGQSSVT